MSTFRPLSDEKMEECCLVDGNKTDSRLALRALLSQSGLRWSSSTNSFRCRHPHLVAQRHPRTSETRYLQPPARHSTHQASHIHLSNPSTRYMIMAFRLIISSFSLALALAFALPVTPLSQIVSRITCCRRRRCQPQQPQTSIARPSLPYDTPIICARFPRQSHPVRCADPSHSLPRAQGYLRYLHTSPASVGVVMWWEWEEVSDVSTERQRSARRRLRVPWYGMPETSTVSP